MSTRRLILASLLCGIAILVAGGLNLFQATSDGNRVDATLLVVGESTVVGDLAVAVVDVSRTDNGTLVTVEIGRSDDAAPIDDTAVDVVAGWRMLADGALTSPRDVLTATGGSSDGECGTIPVVGRVACVLDFGVANGTPTFIYSRNGSQAQWLAGT